MYPLLWEHHCNAIVGFCIGVQRSIFVGSWTSWLPAKTQEDGTAEATARRSRNQIVFEEKWLRGLGFRPFVVVEIFENGESEFL